jgi:type IV pilus biogenesis/stability protein PilW
MKKLILLVAVISAGGCITKKKQSRASAKTDLGTAYLAENNDELAIATLREAVDLDRKNYDAWHMLAMAYMRKGAYEESERAFKKASRLKKGDASILTNYSYLLIKLGRTGEAIEQLELAREDLTYRKPAVVLNSLGYAYYTEGDCDSATARLQEAVFRAPNFCQAWFHLGLAHECGGRVEDAMEAYDRVILTCPDESAGAWYRICTAMDDQGRVGEARDACNELLSLPDLPREIRTDALERLDGMGDSGR